MDINSVFSLVSTLAIVVGLVFAGVQLRQLNKQGAREYALQLLHSFQTLEFQNASKIIFELPEGLSKKEIEERLGNKLTSVLSMLGTFESLGILIYRREIDIQLVEDFISGDIIHTGKKFKNYLKEMRELTDRQTYYEWFQWMYEQIEKRESKTPPMPAYIEYQNWKP
jgi:superfamily I DNA/RNA helicase